jgi:glycosyltransferase involved in cell wall biosynthesis
LFGERAGRLAASLVRAGEADVVHAFGASGLGYARQRATLGAPLVLNPQGLEEFGATGARLPFAKRLGYTPLRWAVRRVARAADAILATDRALEETVTRHLAPAPGVQRTIPNGIDLVDVASHAGPAEGAIARQRHSIAPDALVLLSVGRLERNKGFDVLVAALARASAPGRALAGVPWRWVLIGAGPEKAALDAEIAGAGLGAHVLSVGRASDADLHAWYEAATVFVHPTRYEGSSLVTLEAMAHRRPAVATRAGGLPDKVRDGVNGWLVEPDDAEALAAALESAAGTPRDRLARMGAASRALVEAEFAWPTLAQKHVELYRELVGTGGSGDGPARL